MVNRPARSVRAVRFTPPLTEVAVTLAFSMGALSGPVTWPRMTSTPCARAFAAVARRRKQASAAMRRNTLIGVGRDVAANASGVRRRWTRGKEERCPAAEVVRGGGKNRYGRGEAQQTDES